MQLSVPRAASAPATLAESAQSQRPDPLLPACLQRPPSPTGRSSASPWVSRPAPASQPLGALHALPPRGQSRRPAAATIAPAAPCLRRRAPDRLLPEGAGLPEQGWLEICISNTGPASPVLAAARRLGGGSGLPPRAVPAPAAPPPGLLTCPATARLPPQPENFPLTSTEAPDENKVGKQPASRLGSAGVACRPFSARCSAWPRQWPPTPAPRPALPAGQVGG